MTKKKVFVDPRYSVGNERRKNIQQIISAESQDLYRPQRDNLLGGDTRYMDYPSAAPTPKDIYPDIDDDGKIVQQDAEEPSIFDGFSYRNEHSSLVDAWRMTFEKGYQSRYLAKANQLQDINNSLDEVKEVQQYKDQLQIVSDIEGKLYRAQAQGADSRYVLDLQNQLSNEYKILDELEGEIKSKWKRSDVLLDLFTDVQSYNDPRKTNTATRIAADIYNFGPTGNANYNGNVINDAFEGTKRLFDAISNTAGGIISALRGTAETLSGSDKGSYLKRAIKNSPDDIHTFDHLFDSYKNHKGGSTNYIRSLQQKIDKMRNDLERDKIEKETDLKNTLDTYRNGNWLFDPRKIDPIYKKMQEEDDRGILKTIVDPSQWLYAAPEIGSSFSDLADFTGLLLLNGGAEYAASKLATTALMRNPLSRGIYEASVIGGGLYFSNQMRRMETDAEATDAYSNRVIKEAEEKGIDLGRILNQTNSHLQGLGINPEGLNTLEQLQLALAYNAPTDDSEFNAIKKEARKGIAKVVNENNALSFMDYLQAIPFMNYSRGIVGKFGSGVFGNTGLSSKIIEGTAMAGAAKKTANGIIDSFIDKAANKVASNLATKVAIARTSKYIKNKAKTFGMVGLIEGVEEGQQQLLQNRFARGEYDGYDRYESAFDLPSVFEDAGLAFDALRAYWGLNPSDPDNSNEELIKAMNIGAVTGMMFGLGHTLTNIMPSDQDNIRNLVASLKNDAVVRRIVAEQQKDKQDSEHVGIFFDSFSKAGVNASRLNDSLEQLKRFKGSLVTDEDINRDQELMQKAWYTYKNPLLSNIMEDLGIKKDSPLHRDFVQAAVRESMRLSDIRKKGAEVVGNIDDNLDAKLHRSHGTPEEAGSSLYSIVQKIKERYQKAVGRKVNSIAEIANNPQAGVEPIYRNKTLRDITEKELKSRGIEYTMADLDEETTRLAKDTKRIDSIVREMPSEFGLSDEDSFVENYITRMFDSSLVDNANTLIQHLKDKKSYNEFLKKMFGEDVDIDSLDGIIRYVEEERDRIKAKEDEFLEDINKAVSEHNKIIRHQNKQRAKEGKDPIKEIEPVTVKSQLKDLGEFEDQTEIDRLQILYLMNNAMEKVQAPYSDAFMFGEVRPDLIIKSIKPANWSELSQEQRDEYTEQVRKRYEQEGRSDKFKGESTARALYNNDIQKSISKMKSLVKKHDEIKKRMAEQPEGEASFADIDDLREVSKEAAKLFISERLKQAQSNKEKAREEAPVTPDDVEAAEQGDEKAAKRVEGAAKLAEEVSVNEPDVELHEKPRERKSAIIDELEDEVNDVIAGEEFDKTKKQSKKLREQEEAERKASEKAEMDKLEGEELTKFMIEHPDLMVNAFDNPANFLNDYDIIEHVDKLKNGQVLFYWTDDNEKTHYATIAIGPVVQEDIDDGVVGENVNVGDICVIIAEYDPQRGECFGISELTFNVPKGYVFEDDKQVDSIQQLIYSPDDVQKHQLIVQDFFDNEAILHKPGIDTGVASDPDDNIGSGKARENDDVSGEDASLDSEESQDNDSNIVVNNSDDTLSVEDDIIDPGHKTPSDIHVEPDGSVFVDGDPTDYTINVDPDTLEVEPIDEQQLLVDLNSAFGAEYDDYVSSNQKNKNRKEVVDSDDVGQFIESTFFYQPENETPMKLVLPNGDELTETKNGKRYFDGKEVMPGKEFGKQLAKKGWFDSIPDENKYYVVSQHKGNTDKTNPDGFTITLVIEDGDKVYLSSIRTPEVYTYEDDNGEVSTVNGIERIKASLRMINVDQDKFEDNLNERIEDAFNTTNPTKIGKPWGVKIGWFNKLPNDNKIKQQTILQARMRSQKKTTKYILSEDEIDRQIERLRKNRMQIIDAYCDKDASGNYVIPTKIRKDVHPQVTEISNGKIDRTDKLRPVTKEGDVQTIQKLIDDNKIRIGIGLGGMRYIRDKFAITNVFVGRAKYHGKGLSGKLYMIVEGPGMVDSPIQLSEELFNTQKTQDNRVINLHRSTDNLKLGITLNNKGFGEVTSNTSAAEVLLYLICNKLAASELPTATSELQRAFVELFINCDGKTVMNDDRRTQNGFPEFAAKQLAFEKGVFTIGEQDLSGDWHPVPYEMDEIFGDSPEQIATRRNIIYQIAENMHWNTDRDVMTSKFNDSLLRAFRQWFESNPKATSFKLCGLDQFEFKKEDLFDTDKDGRIIRQKNISVLAWMLKTGKLMTDATEQMFYAPFVYADGVASTNKKNDVVKKTPHPVKSVVEKSAEDQIIEESIKDVEEKIANVETKLGKDFVARVEDRKQAILDTYQSTQAVNGGLEDILAIDLGSDRFGNIEDVKKKIHTVVEEYIDKQNKKREDGKKIQLSAEDWGSIDQMTKLNLKAFNNGKMMPVLYVTKNGTGSTLVISTVEDIKADANITGVASKHKSPGKYNKKRTYDWIKKTLGLDESQMITIEGVIRSCSDGDVYGLTQICCDVLDRPFGAFTFSEQAGRGIGYHEAWHYVNLLLHNKAQRLQMYKAYVQKHPELKSAKFKDIEEAMAEDFRKYGEMMNEHNISNVLKRWLNNILDFLFSYRKRDLIRNVYESIQRGDYAKIEMDPESLQEFKKTYPTGVSMARFSYANVRPSEIENLDEGIHDYHTFQQVGISLAHKLLEHYDVQTIEDLTSINSESFQAFMQNLYRKNQTERNVRRKRIVDIVIKNSGAFKTIADRVLKQYGVTPKSTKKGKLLKDLSKLQGDQEENREPVAGLNKEDAPTNIWDIESIEVSKKANVAFRAKLFLSQIPDAYWQTVEIPSGDKVKYTRKMVVRTDDILGATIYVPYGKAWNKVMNALWQAESFGKKVNGQYTRSSIMGIVERRKDAEPFFAQLWDRLQQAKGDIQLESQIFCTVASSKNQIATLQLSDKKMSKAGQEVLDQLANEDPEISEHIKSKDAGSIADRMRVWDMFDDNNLRAKKNLPRVWSKTAVASGMIKYEGNKSIVSQTYADHINSIIEYNKDGDSVMQLINAANKQLNRLKNKARKELYIDGINDQIEDKLLEVLKLMGIPFDRESLNYYIQMHLDNPQQLSNPLFKYNGIRAIIDNGSQPGGIRFFVKQINDAAKRKRDYFTSGDNKTKRPIDQLFTGYSDDHEITKMAQAFNTMNPSSSDFSVVGPDGDMIYPISQNNFMSDAIRWLNNSSGEKAMELQRDPYARHSVILDVAKDMDYENLSIEDMFKLDTFVGLKDSRIRRGNDYFGITPMEDYIAKMFMLFQDRLVLPTMADKKTWYAIKFGDNKTKNSHVTPHEIMRYDSRTYSGDVINIFSGYFKDELEALKQYYSRDNIKYLIDHPGELRENFHGNVKNGRMDFSGNGGKFRYFYDVLIENNMNLNERLQFEYNRQKAIESGEYKSKNGIAWMYEDENELDGFELIRKFLNELENKYFGENSDALTADITDYLNNIVDQELKQLAKPGSLNIVTELEDGRYISRAIPYQILDWYSNKYFERGFLDYKEDPYGGNENVDADLTLSAITNNVLGSMMSVIEVEKVFSGDPAFYKWKYKKGKTRKVTASVEFEDGVIEKFTTNVDILAEKHTDKIKRLGAVLSPGDNLNINFSEEILKEHPELRGSKYTNLNISDAIAMNSFIEEITGIFERSALVDVLRNTEKYSGKYTEEELENLYTDESAADKIMNSIKKDNIDLYNSIKDSAQSSVNPYTKINVSDAQVIIRPALYRKIRIALGEWSFIEDVDGYSDEAAFNILENDSEWMRDPEKAAIVSKLQLKPLKMTYFMNDPKDMSYSEDGTPIISNMPMYNKMAIFPLFKYAASSKTGKQLYDRMNMEGNELDMITFESAVKVGGHKNKYSPFENKTKDISTLDEAINRKSSFFLSKEDSDYGEAVKRESDGERLLDVQVQDLSGLHLQLNTDAHHNDSRAIGTQMFKIAFSNIIEKANYNGRTGHQIRADIMACINSLTKIGVFNLRDEFYNSRVTEDGVVQHKLNQKAVDAFIKRIVENNGLGAAAEEIIGNGGVIASLSSRKVFEQSTSATVNGEVVDLNTKGGSAVQQSTFGFVGYGKNAVLDENAEDWNKLKDQQNFPLLNGGKELQWYRKDGNMEIMLSMNFFKSVVPKEEQTTYENMRNWLFEHNIIGTNAKPFGVGYRIPTQGMSSMFSFVVADVLPQQSGDLIIVPKEFTAQTGSDFDVDKIYMAFMSYTNGEFDAISDRVFNAIKNANKPYMSMEEVFGELALEIMKNPEGWDERRQELSVQHWHNAIANRLLGNYIDIIKDIKNFSDARASIDTITNKIGDELLPLVREQFEDYRSAGYELTPSFQANTKREFKTGKDGISPFALHITNMAMTQFTNMCMDYGDNEFGFRNLDEILGKDNIRISAWLSAMVNAHVDVAKDPYVFAINVNKATYNHVCFLLRAGMGLSTFTFMSQPILKEYAEILTDSGGFYGPNIDGSSPKTNVYTGRKNKIYRQLLEKAKEEAANAIDKKVGINSQEEYNKLYEKFTNIISEDSHDVDWKEAFDENIAKQALVNPESAQAKYFQLLVLKSFNKIGRYADELSRLVHLSQIDTKKFGNDIALQKNFENSLNLFKFGDHSVKWYINNDEGKQYVKDNPDDKSYAYRKYFGSLFLDDKFENAKNFTRQILSRQTYIATNEFDGVFKSLMQQLNGTVKVTRSYMSNGTLIQEPLDLYGEIKDEDFIKSISQAIDDIMRYRVLMHNGVRTLNRFKRSQDEGSYSGPIDFTFGGDPQILASELERLFNGLKESEDEYSRNSVFKNLADLIRDIQQNGFSEDYEGLTDPNTGEIINDFLKFLLPQLPSSTNEIGRMLLFKNAMSMDPDEKPVLIAGFDQLLRHSNKKIRRIARDVAIYAYYSTYDVNTANSFFDLVPAYYRKQYDLALKMGLRASDDSLANMISGDTSLGIESDIADIIARNFWYDDNVVPVYYEHFTSKLNKEWTELRTHRGRSTGKSRFSGAILTSYADSPFIKVVKGDDVMLYKNVGFVRRTPVSTETKAPKNRVSIYMAIPKLGYHKGNVHHYEFSGNEHIPSIFKAQNKISLKFEREQLEEDIRKLVPVDGKTFTYEIVYDAHIPYVDTKMYFKDNSRNSDAYINDSGNLRFVATSDLFKIKKKKSDVIIDIDSTANEKFDNRVGVKHTDSTQKIINAIIKKIGDNESPILYFANSDINIVVTKQEIKEYADEMVALQEQFIRDASSEGISEPHLKEELESYRNDNQQEFEEGAKRRKLNQKLFDILSGVIIEGRGRFKIRGVYAEGTTGVGAAAANAIMLTSAEFEKPNAGGQMLIDEKYKMLRNNEEFQIIREQFAEPDNTFVSADWQQQQIKAIREFVDSADEITADMQKLSEQVASETIETVKEVEQEIKDNNKPKQTEKKESKKEPENLQILEESKKDEPQNLEVDQDATPVDIGSMFGKPKKYHLMC